MKLGFIIGAMFAFAQGGLVSQPLTSGSLGGLQDKSLIQGNFIQGGFQGQPVIQNTIQGFQSVPLIQSGLQSIPLNPGNIIQGGPLIQGNIQGGFQGAPLIQSGGFQSQPINQVYIQTEYAERPLFQGGFQSQPVIQDSIQGGFQERPIIQGGFQTIPLIQGNTIQGESLFQGRIQDGLQNRPLFQSVSNFQGRFQPGLTPNPIKNGNFQNPSIINQQWRNIKNLPGWQIKQIEQGFGRMYNSRWGNTIVIQLDGHQNDCLKQRVDLSPGYYQIQFDYAARVGHVPSCAFSVSWNGQRVQFVQASDEQIHRIYIPVESRGGSNILQIRGQGKSDTYGMTITDVQIQPYGNSSQYPDYQIPGSQWRVTRNQYFQNSDFQSPTINSGHVFLKQLPGWSIKQIQQGIGSFYNKKWGNKVVLQLDANKNEGIQQTIRLNRGVYRFEMNYAAREGKINTSQFALRLNDNIVQNIVPIDEKIHKIFYTFIVNQPGDFVFGIYGDGPSDSCGVTIGQVSLFALQEQDIGRSQGIICYNRNRFDRNPR